PSNGSAMPKLASTLPRLMTEPNVPPILEISVTYNGDSRDGSFEIKEPTNNTVWTRLKQAAMALSAETRVGECRIDLSWPSLLEVLREYGTKEQQRSLGFRF